MPLAHHAHLGQVVRRDGRVVLGHQIVVVFAHLHLIDLDAGVGRLERGDFRGEIIAGAYPEIQRDRFLRHSRSAQAQQQHQ